MPTIILMLKGKAIAEIPLAKTVTSVGRAASNDIPIDNLAVSGFHARIVNDNGVCVVEDLNSTNGTFVNNQRISKILLNDNDVITVGKHSLVFSNPRARDTDDTTRVRGKAREETVYLGSLSETPQPQLSKDVLPGRFVVEGGPAEKREYALTARVTTIGKSGTAEIRLQGFFSPRVAAVVTRVSDGYVISPPDGGRKVRVNDAPITGQVRLKHGDIVDVHKLRLRFSTQG